MAAGFCAASGLGDLAAACAPPGASRITAPSAPRYKQLGRHTARRLTVEARVPAGRERRAASASPQVHSPVRSTALMPSPNACCSRQRVSSVGRVGLDDTPLTAITVRQIRTNAHAEPRALVEGSLFSLHLRDQLPQVMAIFMIRPFQSRPQGRGINRAAGGAAGSRRRARLFGSRGSRRASSTRREGVPKTPPRCDRRDPRACRPP